MFIISADLFSKWVIFSISGSLHRPSFGYRMHLWSVGEGFAVAGLSQTGHGVERMKSFDQWLDWRCLTSWNATNMSERVLCFLKWVSMLINVWYSLRFVLSHANYANLLTSVTSSLFSTCHDGKGCPGALGALCSGKQATKHSGNSVRALGLGAVRSFRWGFLHLPPSPTKLSSVSRTCQPMWTNVNRCQLTWPRAVFDWPQPSAEIGLAATHGRWTSKMRRKKRRTWRRNTTNPKSLKILELFTRSSGIPRLWLLVIFKAY